MGRAGWDEFLRARGWGDMLKVLLALGPVRPGSGTLHTYVLEGRLGQIWDHLCNKRNKDSKGL